MTETSRAVVGLKTQAGLTWAWSSDQYEPVKSEKPVAPRRSVFVTP